MEYAILYWLRHLEAGLSSSSSGQDELCKDLIESLEILVEQHWNNPTVEFNPTSNRIQEVLEAFSGCEKFQEIRQIILSTSRDLKTFGDVRTEQSALDMTDTVMGVRRCLEKVLNDHKDLITVNDLKIKYGTNLYRCPRFSCVYFTRGFSTPGERERHVGRHERPARCTDEHCRGSKIGFATQAQLERHLKETHPDMTERDHSFPTEEEVMESVRDDQPDLESSPEIEPPVIPVAELAADSASASTAVAPRSSQVNQSFKRQKTKQGYECEHCGKKFNKKWNWQSHLATHGGEQTFTCRLCTTTCARSGDLSRHMRLHNSDSSFTCGGVLMNGQSWGCGATFARADILRSHHKSKKGRQCVAERDSN